MKSPAQSLLHMKDDLLAYHAIMSGEFEKEIARLVVLNKQIEDKLGMVQIIEDAHERAAVIIQDAKEMAEAAEKKVKEVLAQDAAAKVREAALQVRENVVRQQELETQKAWNDFTDERDSFFVARAGIQSALDARQADMNKAAQDVKKLKEEVEAKAARVAAALGA